VPTFEEVMALVALPEDTVSLCLAANLLAEIGDLQRQRAEAPPPSNLGERSPASVLDERIAEVAEQMKASTVAFKLLALNGREWIAFHAARPVMVKDEPDAVWQERIFPWLADMVSRTCVEPAMTPEQVGELVDRLPAQSWALLQNACYDINIGVVEAPNFAAVSSPTTPSDETSKPPTGPDAAIRNGSAQSRRKSRPSSTTETVSPAA
jgi:hypothetical protein